MTMDITLKPTEGQEIWVLNEAKNSIPTKGIISNVGQKYFTVNGNKFLMSTWEHAKSNFGCADVLYANYGECFDAFIRRFVIDSIAIKEIKHKFSTASNFNAEQLIAIAKVSDISIPTKEI